MSLQLPSRLFFPILLTLLSLTEFNALADASVFKGLKVAIKTAQVDPGFPKFKLKTETPDLIFQEDEESNTHFFAEIVLDSVDPSDEFIYEGEELRGKEGAQPSIQLKIPILQEETPLSFKSVDPEGNVKTLELVLECRNIQQLNETYEIQEAISLKEDPDQKLNGAIALGTSFINYEEGAHIRISEVAPTIKAVVRYPLEKNWNLSWNGFYNFATWGGDSQKRTIRFLGSNLRAGYVIPFQKLPWTLTLQGGLYFNTSFASSNTFGYSPLVLLHFLPTLKAQLTPKLSLNAYVKYTPAGRGISLLNFNELELAAGFGIQKMMRNRHPLFVNLDYSYLKMNISRNTIPLNVNLSTLTFAIGYGF